MLFYYDDERMSLDAIIRANIEQAACLAIERELGIEDARSLPLELGITVVDKEEIKSINSEYRGIDKVTDVLSFPQFESAADLEAELSNIELYESELEPSAESSSEELLQIEDGEDDESDEYEYNIMLGDVVLCYDKACEQAEEYETGIERELVYLAVHSVLHLLGYDHMEDSEKKIMRAREEEILNEIGIHRNNR